MRRQLALLIPVMWIGACKRPQPVATTAAPAPTTEPAAIAVDTTPKPTTRPLGPTFMLVGDESVEFPPARVVVTQPGDKLAAMLFSIDPPDAIKKDYRGNSFYFDMAELSLADPSTINGAAWMYRAPDSDRQDSNDGLFINGHQYQLQPFDVQVLIDGESTPLRVKLAGTFLKFDNANDSAPGVRVNVRAEFEAELKK